MEALAVVLILAAIAYILYRWSSQKDTINCPSCGDNVNLYADKCPSCGHEKGEALKERLDEVEQISEEVESVRTESEPEDEDEEEVVDEETPDGEIESAEEHVCSQCGKEFDSEQGLNIHKGMKH